MARLKDWNKSWKASMADVAERKLWPQYMAAYEDMIRHTTPQAPWYVLPADHNWFVRMVMAMAIVDALERLHVDFPKPDRARLRELQRMRRVLQAS